MSRVMVESEFFAALFERSETGLIILDDARRPLSVNPVAASYLTTSVEEAATQPIEASLALCGDAPPQWASISTQTKSGGIITIEAPGARRLDLEFLAFASLSPGRHLLTLRDVTTCDDTRRRALEEGLRQAGKMEALGQLAGGVAHDFANLLTVIIGNSELLLQRTPPDSPAVAKLNVIKQAGQQATSLVRHLLTFSRKQSIDPIVLNLNDQVAKTEGLLRRVIGENIRVVCQLDPGIERIKADSGQVAQVLMNLVINARDAMPNGGQVTIETANAEVAEAIVGGRTEVFPGKYVTMSVTDTGDGMDQATMARLFEPFFTTKSPDKGTGLGLAIVYGALKQVGGSITVRSALGQGTTFKLFFPITLEVITPAAPKVAGARSRTPMATILLVEDDAPLLGLVAEMLRSKGYAVLSAPGGNEALAVADAHGAPVHLLVSDIVMPEMSGHELARRMQTRQPQCRVLFLTGYPRSHTDEPGAGTARGPTLLKPFAAETLTQMVGDILGA